jgi:Tol biopolymer transport system component
MSKKLALLALILGVGAVSASSGVAGRQSNGLLLYSQTIGGKAQLFTVRPDGTGRRQLTRGVTEAQNAEWSPDGRSIAFERIIPTEERAAVALMDADGSRLRELTPTGFQGDPSFTPTGRGIVFTRDPRPMTNGIWIMRVDGSGLRPLTRNPFAGDGFCGCDEGAAVSPDGRTITFARSRNARERALFAIGIDGKGLRRLTPWHLGPPRHAWSPDGKRIVVTLQASASANVVTMRSDGSDVRRVTRFSGGVRHAYAGSYSPDGAWLAIRVEGGGSYGIYVVRPDGTGMRRIVTSKRAPQTGIDWGIR